MFKLKNYLDLLGFAVWVLCCIIILVTTVGVILYTTKCLVYGEEILVYKDEYILHALSDWCPWKPGMQCAAKVAGDYILVDGEYEQVKLVRGVDLTTNGTLTSKASLEIVPYDEDSDICKTRTPTGFYCSPNYVVSINKFPNDTFYKDLWGMERIDIRNPWKKSLGEGAYVFVIDTGIYRHSDLKENIKEEFSFNAVTGEIGLGKADDDNGHGTHCAGTVAAVYNNAFGIAGVAPKAKVIPIKFITSSGSGSTFNAIKAIDYVSRVCELNDIKLCIISASWGGGGFSQPLFEALKRFSSKGGLFIAAAGNEHANNDTNPHYPSNYSVSNIISVSALDPTGKLAPYSNYGKETVDIAAPGSGILSLSHTGSGFRNLSGSSMATPHVSGAAAVLWSYRKEKDAGAIKQRILSTCRQTKNLKSKNSCNGELRVKRAIRNFN